MTPTPEQCIEQYVRLRGAKEAREKALKAEIAEYTAGLEAIENYLLSVMLERKEVQIKTAHGTAFQSPQMRAKLVDRQALVDYVKRTGDSACSPTPWPRKPLSNTPRPTKPRPLASRSPVLSK